MKESNPETVAANEELKRQYENLDDLKAAHSVLMRQLFKMGEQKEIGKPNCSNKIRVF